MHFQREIQTIQYCQICFNAQNHIAEHQVLESKTEGQWVMFL